jgi:hypothetical protein
LQVLVDRGHRVHRGNGFGRDLAFDQFQIVLDQIENLFRGEGLSQLA